MSKAAHVQTTNTRDPVCGMTVEKATADFMSTAAGILFPASGLFLSPMAAAAMSRSSVSVLDNAPRLRSLKLT